LIVSHGFWALEEVPAYQIDEMNIFWATLWAMKGAVTKLYSQLCVTHYPDELLILVDGPKRIPTAEEAGEGWLEVPVRQEAIKGGDDLHKAIGAASIVAKVYRDSYMMSVGDLFPEYGFCQHKGYGTLQHREAIKKYGPCPLHRRTFRGVYEYVRDEHVQSAGTR
jgi:ribonuclease HII